MPTLSKQILRSRKPSKEHPQLFGRGGRDRCLIALSVNGPLTVRELGRTIGSDSSKTWKMIDYLQRCGLVVKRNRLGGRKYIAINRRLSVHRSLLRLLQRLDEKWPSGRLQKPSYRWNMWNDDDAVTSSRLDLMFFSPIRSRVLLYVAAVGTSNMQTLVALLGIGPVSALYAINHWERENIIRTKRVGQHRLVDLNPSYYASDELKGFLDQLIRTSEEYLAIRKHGRSRMRPILKTTETSQPTSRKVRSK